MATESTTSHGTRYEHLVLRLLQQHLGFKLTHVGGRSDRGIDLLGFWSPPTATATSSTKHPFSGQDPAEHRSGDDAQDSQVSTPQLKIPVLVQCKAHRAQGSSPAWIRELEGAMNGVPLSFLRTVQPQAQGGDGSAPAPSLLGVLVATGKATPGIRQAVNEASKGLIWIQTVEDSTPEDLAGAEDGVVVEGQGRIEQMLWNAHVKALVGSELGTGYVYRQAAPTHNNLPGAGRGQMVREMRLSWKGRIWQPKEDEE